MEVNTDLDGLVAAVLAIPRDSPPALRAHRALCVYRVAALVHDRPTVLIEGDIIEPAEHARDRAILGLLDPEDRASLRGLIAEMDS